MLSLCQPIEVKMVAAALRRSPVAAKTWTQLYDALNLDDLTKREYEMLVEMGYITYEDLFLRIMVQWVSIEGANATWKSLVGAIKQTGDRKTNGYVMEAARSLAIC